MKHRLRVITLLAAALAAPLPARAQSVVWTLIDVQSRLDNDGRLHVIETHHLDLREGGDFKPFREFGLAVDQSIIFHSLTRIGPGAEETPLKNAEVGGPDRYRYYPRGHVYFSIPAVERGAAVVYRFEYELVNAMSPAWAIAAGKGPLARPTGFDPPLARLREVVADVREAWSGRDRLYRLDHDILLPSRDGPGYVVRDLDYHLSFDSAWKMVDPDADLGKAQRDQDYRVRRVFERVVDEPPAGVDRRAALLRWTAVAALFALVPVLWLVALVVEGVGKRLAGRITAESAATTLADLAPEVVAAFVTGGGGTAPTVDGILSRMAGERKIAIEIEPVAPATSSSRAPEEDDDDDETPPKVALRRLVPLESLPAFERDLLQLLLVGGRREVTGLDLQQIYAKPGFEPWQAVQNLLPRDWARSRSYLAGLFGLMSLGGLVMQVTSMADLDPLPIVIIADVLLLGALRLWPRGYWQGESWLGSLVLLLPGVFASVAATALLLAANPPLPPQAFVGGAVLGLGAYAALLAGARRPWRGEPHATVRSLWAIRHYAERELRRGQPRLEDRFVAHLEAMGLGPRLEAWRNAGGGAGADLASLQADDGAGEASLARPFTGRGSVPFQGPRGWGNALWVPSAEERREMAEET